MLQHASTLRRRHTPQKLPVFPAALGPSGSCPCLYRSAHDGRPLFCLLVWACGHLAGAVVFLSEPTATSEPPRSGSACRLDRCAPWPAPRGPRSSAAVNGVQVGLCPTEGRPVRQRSSRTPPFSYTHLHDPFCGLESGFTPQSQYRD